MRSERGFTLIEVVVAFVVAALVVVGSLQVFGGAFDGSARAERMTRALIMAESKMAEVGATLPLRRGEHRGIDGGLSWVARIEPFDGLDAQAGRRTTVSAFDVTVTVAWGTAPANAVSLRTMKVAAR